MKALFLGLEQLVAVSILLTSALLVTGLLVNNYRASALNSQSAMEKLSAYYEMQQVSYSMAMYNAYPALQSGNSIKIMGLYEYGPKNLTCSLNYTVHRNYVCGIVAYEGKIYLIKVYQNA